MRTATKLLLTLCIATRLSAQAQAITVKHAQGATRGFLAVRAEDGSLIASGEVTQSSRGDVVTSRLTFTFHDGSIDDDITRFSQKSAFHLLSDHHVQSGPFFKKPVDITIDTASGTITSKTIGKDGNAQTEAEHKDLPPDLANGLAQTLLLNVAPTVAPFELPYLAPSGSKSRLVKIAISTAGTDSVRIIGAKHAVTVFRAHLELGGVAGVVAPLVGKEPKDAMFWILEGRVPAVMRIIAQLSLDGPQVSIEQSGVSVPALDQSK